MFLFGDAQVVDGEATAAEINQSMDWWWYCWCEESGGHQLIW